MYLGAVTLKQDFTALVPLPTTPAVSGGRVSTGTPIANKGVPADKVRVSVTPTPADPTAPPVGITDEEASRLKRALLLAAGAAAVAGVAGWLILR